MALRANHIFCDSKSAESDLHYFFPASLGKTSVIHLGHDIERFEKDYQIPMQLKLCVMQVLTH